MEWFLKISFIIAILLGILNLFWSVRLKHTKFFTEQQKIMLKRYEIDTTTKVDPSLFVLLDQFISEVLSDYALINIEGKEEFMYINSKEREKLRVNVAYLVCEQISPDFLQRLSTIYRGEKLTDIIAKKVTIQVAVYVSKKNKIKRMEDIKQERKARAEYLTGISM